MRLALALLLSALLALPAAAGAVPGDPDPSLDGDGTLIADVDGTQADRAADVAVDSAGRIVVVGQVDAPGGGDVYIARFNANGTPDTTFAGTGGRVLAIGGAQTPRGVVVQPNGAIVFG